MNLINNRYRVITELSKEMIKSSYLVSDVIKNNEKIQLNIINSEFVSKKLIDYYISEFITLGTINHKNISRVYDFGLISIIDNKKANKSEYYYTNKYVETSCEIQEIITNINEIQILDIFIELCMVMNYLHMRGFIYGELSTKNIMAYYENNKYNIMLKDLPTIEIEKQNGRYNKEEAVSIKPIEQSEDKKTTIASDIYSMGSVMFALCKSHINDSLDINDKLNIIESTVELEKKIKSKYSQDILTLSFYNNLIKIIKRMTRQKISERYNNINEIVEDVNTLFNKKYKSYIIQEIEKLNFSTKIVGRNEEITKIMSAYESLDKNNSSNKIIFVNGEQGIGKTRLLKEIQHLLYMNKANVYADFTVKNYNSKDKSKKVLLGILKQIISTCDDEIVKRYKSELIKIIPKINVENNNKTSERIEGSKEKYRLISKIYSFIQECFNNKPVIFIIDNANWLDEFSIELLEYINVQNYNKQNIMIILSYGTIDYSTNHKFKQLLNENSYNMNFHLKNLNNEETIIMIQEILSMPEAPTELGQKVYQKTYGNPLFVEETLKEFVAKKIIYVNENNGKWYTPYETIDEMPIASTMQQALLNQIKEINKISYEILSIISIFNTAIPIYVINKFFNDSETSLVGHINELCSKGILIKKIEDMGFVFDFYNNVLKNLIYNRLSDEERKAKHERAASVLEQLFKKNGRENKEELIYHLEKAKDKYRIVKYCIELAEKMKSFRIMDEAIVKYKKAFSMLSDEEDQNKKIELLLEIGDVYLSLGNLQSALESYKKTKIYSASVVEEKLQVDTANKISYIYLRRNEVEKSLKYIKKCELILLNINYMEGYLENKTNLAYAYTAKQEYKKVFDLCVKCIKKCENNYLSHKGFMYNILGILYSETSRIIEALECYKKGLIYFEKTDNSEGMCRCLNNIGVIYADYYQDDITAISYYNRTLSICEENNIIDLELTALVNIATCYADKFDYNNALKYFKDVLKKSVDIGFESNIFYIYNYISYVELKMGNNKDAYKYYVLAQKEVEKYPIQGKDISIYYQMRAEFNYGMGNIDAASLLINNSLKIYNNNGTIQDNNSKLLLLFVNLQRLDKADNIHKYIKQIETVINGYKNNINKTNALYEICIVLYEKGFVSEVLNLFKNHLISKANNHIDMVNIKRMYLEGLLKSGKEKIEILMNVLELSKREKNKYFQWRICSAIGEYYFMKKNYFYAVNYYFEACEIIKEGTMQLPEFLRVNYINAYNMMKPFNMIKGMSKPYAYRNICESREGDINIYSNHDLTILFDYKMFSEILNNKNFVELAKKIYSSILPKGIHNINDIITNMGDDSLQILNVVTKLISSIVLSTRSLIISEGIDGELTIVASSDGNFDITDLKEILLRTKESKNSILVSEPFNSSKNVDFKYMPKNMKSIMCIPIIRKKHIFIEKKQEARRFNEQLNLDNIKGYVYMESERVLNNFNEDSLAECLDLTSFISFVMENYLLKISSSVDKLTGTLTRRFLEDELSQNIEKANVSSGVFSIIMFDLDDFKGVNDKFGHITGDKVLREVSKIVMQSIRKIDLCGRYGGEEFIVILPETDTRVASDIAERIRKNIDNKRILRSKRDLTVSMGIATYPKHGKWRQELVESADKALYVAKANGKNRCQIFENEFFGKLQGTNKLSGIVSGNMVQDSRNVLAMVELIETVKADCDLETKIYNALGRIIETTEAKNGMLFIINQNKITQKFGRRNLKEDWAKVVGFSEGIIENVIIDKQGICTIDWDCIIDYDLVTGMPNWNSALVVPIIKSGVVKGVLYLTVPIKVKEFKFEDLNFVKTLGQLLVGII